jgi:hypothetical protein
MRNHVGVLVKTDDLGDIVLDLLTGPLASTTYNNYGTGMRRFMFFCNEEGITPKRLPRLTCFALHHGSPGPEPSRPTASNPTSQQSTNSFATTLRSQWRWNLF